MTSLYFHSVNKNTLYIMGRKCDLTPRKTARIAALVENTSYSIRKIATIHHVAATSVARIKKKLELGQSLEVKRVGKCGRNRITSPRDERKIQQVLRTNRRLTLKKLKEELDAHEVKLSERTLRRRSYELGFYCRRPRKKPRLTPAMRTKRLLWARQVENWTLDDWRNVCFSDESSFQILSDTTMFVRRKSGEQFNTDCVVNTIKHPTSVMMWAVISGKGVGRLYVVEGTLRQDQYRQVIEARLIPQLREWFQDGERYIFMQDGAPCHTANAVMKFLNDRHIPVLPWPGNSPDMNPLENLWQLVKKRVSKTNITTRQQLIEQIIAVWHRDPEITALARSCIDSMPRRVQALKKAKGGPTKY